MNVITFTALGLELKRYTFLKEQDVKFAIELICESAHSFQYREANEHELSNLSCPLRIIPKHKAVKKNRTVNVPVHIRKYKSQSFSKKRDYVRTKNIYFFEDELETLARHFPELGIFTYRQKNY